MNLIIGGTTKSGTTSLFHYLGEHPQVCQSSMKETRFFLDREYPLASKYRYEDGMERYQEFFSHHRGEKILMEATPDYLYSKDAADKIRRSLSDVKLIFILREPKARFISWYKFSKQIGKLRAEETLQKFLEMQLQDEACLEQHLMALKQGNYSTYLMEYYRHFSYDDIYICYFEDLVREPVRFMNELSLFLDIDPAFYKDYAFEQHNATVKVRNQGFHAFYIDMSFRIRKFTHNRKVLHSGLKAIKKIIYPIYERLNTQQSSSNELTHETNKWLDQYYAIENKLYNSRYEAFHRKHYTINEPAR